MGKIQKLEELALSLVRYKGVEGCAVASRMGQGDILYDSNMGGIDRSLLSTMISSILLIGEKLGHELDDSHVAYHVVSYGTSTVVIAPCDENVALMVLIKEADGLGEVIEASREISRKIGDLLRNRLSED